jgi:hypothetical protein
MLGFRFRGASGKFYEYASLDLRNLPRQAGSFVFARMISGEPEMIFAGQANSISLETTKSTLWSTAQRIHGADSIFIRLLGDAKTRQLEVDDLVARHRPPMNKAVEDQE